MFVRLTSFALQGIEAVPVQVEIDVSPGLPSFDIVGLPDAAVRESRERVRAAVRNGGWPFPPHRITVNLAPAYTKKGGAGFDLAIALGLLAALGEVDPHLLGRVAAAGELALDGSLRPVRGALAMALSAREGQYAQLLLPSASAAEASWVGGVATYGAEHLAEVVGHLRGALALPQVTATPEPGSSGGSGPDLSDVRGQHVARRALEVAAAGGHNILLVGPPGAGKSLLARCLPSILPPLSREESMEVSRIHSVAGVLKGGLLSKPPFRSPHHCASRSAMIGGGTPLRPGEVTLAHRGVLFLDELPEYRREVLEGLRQPLEEGRVQLARASGVETFPAQPLLIAAANPCPCGYLGDQGRPCTCPAGAVAQYRSRLSGPLLDRFDMRLHLAPVPYQDLLTATDHVQTECSATVGARVANARRVQVARLGGGLTCNAHMTPAQVRRYCRLPEAAQQLLRDAIERLGLSLRGHDRVLKVARSIADLAGSPDLELQHVAEALAYRGLLPEG